MASNPAKKKKLLFILDYYYPNTGGVEILFQTVCEDLAKNDYAITILTQNTGDQKAVETHNGVRIHRVKSYGSRFLFVLLGFFNGVKLARDVDLIHTSTFAAAPLASLIAQRVSKKLVLTVHEVWVGKWKQYTDFGFCKRVMYNFLEKCIYRFSYNSYICVSESTKRQLVGVGKSKEDITVIYNAVDYEHWKPNVTKSNALRVSLSLQGKFVTLCFGRPGESKGLRYFVESIPFILKRVPNAHFVLIMSTSDAYKKERAHIAKRITQLGIADVLTILPSQKYADLPHYVGMADCVVVPSLAEGFGFAAAESCAMSVPVVVSETTSLPEVTSGKHVFVQPRDPLSIARGVENVYLKQYSKENLKRFTVSEQIAKYEAFYEFFFSEENSL